MERRAREANSFNKCLPSSPVLGPPLDTEDITVRLAFRDPAFKGLKTKRKDSAFTCTFM